MRNLLIAAAALALSTGATASVISETENNDTSATANLVDGYFDLSYSDDIGDTSSNTSLVIPHVTINAYAEQGGHDTFSFTVTQAGSRGIFDIDYALDYPNNFQGFDANLTIFDADGAQVAFNDDNSTGYGQGGSNYGYDSYIEYIFTAPGVYTVMVGSCCSNQPFNQYSNGNGSAEFNYQLQISLENPADVPEPAMLGLFGLGAIGLGLSRRRKA